MISFIDERAIIEPDNVAKDVAEKIKAWGAKTAVAAFSEHIFCEMAEKYSAVELAKVSGGIDNMLYGVTVDGVRLVIYKSPIGAPAAVMAAEEALACGLKNLVTFGICGALTDVPERTFVVPTRAYRDEGTSGHYVAAGEYIELAGSGRVAQALASYGLRAVTGGAWCTDALYRETPTRCAQMKKLGCVAVDMECSALQAMCDYRKKNFYTFFITADSLASEEWDPNYILDIKLAAPDSVGVAAALRLASELH